MKKKINPSGSEEKKSKRTKKEESPAKGSTSNSGAKSQKTKQENFPGYPPYPASEDIFNNRTEKLEIDEEEILLRKKNLPSSLAENKSVKRDPIESLSEADEDENKPRTDADVTPEEIKLLASDNLNADGGDDDQLRNRVTPVDMSGSDLDVPGSELDDEDEAIGEEDEENNPYSIGGDRHEDLEEDPA